MFSSATTAEPDVRIPLMRRKSFDFSAFRHSEMISGHSASEVAASVHHNPCGIGALSSREWGEVALQFNGNPNLSISVN